MFLLLLLFETALVQLCSAKPAVLMQSVSFGFGVALSLVHQSVLSQVSCHSVLR